MLYLLLFEECWFSQIEEKTTPAIDVLMCAVHFTRRHKLGWYTVTDSNPLKLIGLESLETISFAHLYLKFNS